MARAHVYSGADGTHCASGDTQPSGHGATVQALGDIANFNLELADAVAAYPWVRDGISGRAGRAVESLKGMGSNYSALAQLLEQPWFTDGIDDEEFVFIGIPDVA